MVKTSRWDSLGLWVSNKYREDAIPNLSPCNGFDSVDTRRAGSPTS